MQKKFQMIDAKYETSFANISFISLFVSMFLFWIYASFFFSYTKKDSLKKSKLHKIVFLFANASMLFSNILLFFLLSSRWMESGHFPLSNLYESLIFLSWSCTTIHFLTFTKINRMLSEAIASFNIKSFAFVVQQDLLVDNVKNIDEKRFQKFNKLAGCVTAPCALFTNGFASFSLPEDMQKVAPLVPALQSNWLMMHVTVMIISYSALIIGSLLSIAFLVITLKKPIYKQKTELKNEELYKKKLQLETSLNFDFSNSPRIEKKIQQKFVYTDVEKKRNLLLNNKKEIKETILESELLNYKTLPLPSEQLAETLDNLSYRILGLGFPFLTIGILSGAVWANEAWGSYWSWDPKETWALLTWLVFAIYLHSRILKGLRGKKPAMIASLGFLVVWICYLGVNLIGEGLHSYGWFSKNF
jgi:hypothetical protein